jgi:hypothetical protein
MRTVVTSALRDVQVEAVEKPQFGPPTPPGCVDMK